MWKLGCLCAAVLVVAGCGDDSGTGGNNNINNANPGLCGDDVVDPGEVCDDGAANSDVAPDACRNDCRAAWCGDVVIDTDEDCDTGNLAGETCVTRGFTSGTLACADCAFEETGCFTCGDDIKDPTEACDGSDLDGQTCVTLTGLQAGAPICTTGCAFDTSACHTCGNGTLDGDEVCDATDFGGETCASLTNGSMPVGTLGCTLCGDIDISDCHDCGNSIIEGPEECDGANLGVVDECSDLAAGLNGLPVCGGDCRFDLTQCGGCGNGTCEPAEGENAGNCSPDCVCGDGLCDPTETAASCAADCWCGDGQCDGSETGTTCPGDCFCGNGGCDSHLGEDYATCQSDCRGVGDACNTVNDCGGIDPALVPIAICLEANSGIFGTTFPNGYCFGMCTPPSGGDPDPCAHAGGACVSSSGSSFCVKPCAVNSDCRIAEGYECTDPGVGQTVCVPLGFTLN